MKDFRIRCSAIGQIMTNDRSGKGMGETAKTYIETWVKEQIYGRKKEFASKYTDKGIIMEDDALQLVADHYGLGLLIKNEQFYENDFMTGTPDAITSDVVYDVKCPYDCFTFPMFENEIPTKGYFFQAQGYMHLTGVKKYRLCYCLMDTPAHIILSEAKRFAYQNGYDGVDQQLLDEFTAKMTYGNIPEKYRLKVYEIAYDEAVIESVIERVKLCREYVKTLTNDL